MSLPEGVPLTVALAKLLVRLNADLGDHTDDSGPSLATLLPLLRRDDAVRRLAQGLFDDIEDFAEKALPDVEPRDREVAVRYAREVLEQLERADDDTLLRTAIRADDLRAELARYAAGTDADLSPDAVALSERMLDHVTEHISHLAIQSPGFVPAALAELLRGEWEFRQQVAHDWADVPAGVRRLHTIQVEEASPDDVLTYLTRRLVDWDVPAWRDVARPPSVIECQLRVREGTSGGAIVTAEEALAASRMLAVIGGPGSGKTWLARRYAREAAQDALIALSCGMPLHRVELPILTTWDQWTKYAGSTQETLIEATFGSGSGHSALPSDLLGRLKRTLANPAQPVLAIVDSLDEAAYVRRQSARLAELEQLTTWRVVMTSRPAAWEISHRDDGFGTTRVVDIQDLSYPEDVHRFVDAWFADDPDRAAALRQAIDRRGELRRAAVIPLLLTFYCLVAEGSDDLSAALPTERWRLYEDLIRTLILGEWRPDGPGPHAAPDPAACTAILKRWAWSAIQAQNTPAGLGVWSDTFVQPEETIPEVFLPAIDHLAPLQSHERGRSTRRFVHRTLLDHFVARYVADLSADEAAEVLLPHLWFDSDWEMTAPAAIAAHNRLRPGELMELLAGQLLAHRRDPAARAPQRQLGGLLLSLAELSSPDEWRRDHRRAIHDARVRFGLFFPGRLAATAHWVESNDRVRAMVLAALRAGDTGPAAVGRLARTLPALDCTDDDRRRARTAVLSALPLADPDAARRLERALESLIATPGERAETLQQVFAALGEPGTPSSAGLAGVLPALVGTQPERDRALDWALASLPALEPTLVPTLVRIVPDLVSDQADAQRAHEAIRAALAHAEPGLVGDLARLLVSVVSDPQSRTLARDALLAALPTAPAYAARDMVGLLSTLGVSPAEQATIRQAMLRALPEAEPMTVSSLVEKLVLLDATEAELVEACGVVMPLLPTAEPRAVAAMVWLLFALPVTAEDWIEAQEAVFQALPTAGPWAAKRLAAILPAMVVTDVDRAKAREAVNQALRSAQPRVLTDLVGALPQLQAPSDERVSALADVLDALGVDDPDGVRRWTVVISTMVSSAAERAVACAAILRALPDVHPASAGQLAELLPPLVDTAEQRTAGLRAVLAALPAAASTAVGELAQVLPALITTEGELNQARRVVLGQLRTVAPEDLDNLVWALRRLSTTEAWLDWLASLDQAPAGETNRSR